ncbi:kinase [Thraustotheca clavata]|uniref:Kinase n=1 Tax=Thraustotheca clavata TaxID=74557 RepID=A0A1W0A8U0_9STRA|nr:kinase [Thraustotheca clavata]
MDVQQPSALVCLPTELRTRIYTFLLGFTVRRGFHTKHNESKNQLIWTSTCREIYQETSLLLYKQVGFDFSTTQAFFDTIKTLPSIVTRQLRQIRMIGYLLPLNPDTQSFTTYREAINFIPNLKVDHLMIEDYFHPPTCFESDYLSDEMTRHQITNILALDGWTTLSYVSFSTGFLTLSYDDQVATWDCWLKETYGPDSSVTVYVATAAHCPPQAYHILQDESERCIEDLTNFIPWTPNLNNEPPKRPCEVRVLAKRGSKNMNSCARTLDFNSEVFQQQYMWAQTIAEDAMSIVNSSLTTWPVADSLSALTFLDISNNRFTTIPSAIPAFNASGNPLLLTPLQIQTQKTFFQHLTSFQVDVAVCSTATTYKTFTDSASLAEASCIGSNNDAIPTSVDHHTEMLSPTAICLITVGGFLVIVAAIIITVRRRRIRTIDTTWNVDSGDIYHDPTNKEAMMSSLSINDMSSLKKPKDAVALALQTKFSTDTELMALCLPQHAVLPTRLLARSEGRVYETWLGHYKDQYVVIKKLTSFVNDVEANAIRLVQEMRSLSRLHHPNIVGFVGIINITIPEALGGVMEHCIHGDLQTLLQSHKEWSWECEKYSMALNIACALEYLHGQTPIIIHRDIRSHNVLVTSSNYQCKLTNFESSRTRSIVDTMTQEVGTMQWIAPEVLRGEDYCEAIDVYSFGVLLSELDTHEIPFHDRLQDNAKYTLVQEIVTGRIQPSFNSSCPSSLLQLAKHCLQFDPSKRPPIKVVVQTLEKLQNSFSTESRRTSTYASEGILV